MSDLDNAYAALHKADVAGNAEDARKIANYIREQEKLRNNPAAAMAEEKKSGRPPEESGHISGLSTGEMVADTAAWVGSKFKMREGKPFSVGEASGDLAGGALAGGITGAVAPAALKTAGKAVPGLPGAMLTGLGDVLGAVPTRDRVVGGAGGGGAMSLIDTAIDTTGLPAALKVPADALASGGGETAAKFLFQSGATLANATANAITGEARGSFRALAAILKPNQELDEKAAVQVQKTLFGQKTEGYNTKAIGTANQTETAMKLREADPSLPGFDKVATPASEIYKNRLDRTVTQGLQQGKQFSTSAPARTLETKLHNMMLAGEIGESDVSEIMGKIRTDSHAVPKRDSLGVLTSKGNEAVQQQYPQTVDNLIREWGKQNEKGASTGAKAIDDRTANKVREAVRESWNEYLDKGLGQGKLERDFRNAYQAEKIAEAKDKLPFMLQKGFASSKDFDAFARNLAKDPQALPILQQGMTKHLANVPPKAILSEFERLQSKLVIAKLLTPEETADLAQKAKVVSDITDEGLKMKLADRMQKMILMTVSQKLGATAGGAAGQQPQP